jgi:hypothetical protein
VPKFYLSPLGIHLLLLELVRLQGVLQKGGDLQNGNWPLGTRFVMSQKKKFRTHQDRAQQSLLVKQNKGKDSPTQTGAGTQGRCTECSNVRGVYGKTWIGVWLKFALG